MLRNRKIVILLSILIITLLTGALTGCAGKGAADQHDMPMAPLNDMPKEVQSAAVSVQQAYQFAVANPELTQQFPCYCGCGDMGHTSNYSCYVQEKDAEGKITFDTHALGCSICVDITQDVMRLSKEGKSTAEMQTYVDNTYSQYGPSNINSAGTSVGPAGPTAPGSASSDGVHDAEICSSDGSKPCAVTK